MVNKDEYIALSASLPSRLNKMIQWSLSMQSYSSFMFKSSDVFYWPFLIQAMFLLKCKTFALLQKPSIVGKMAS